MLTQAQLAKFVSNPEALMLLTMLAGGKAGRKTRSDKGFTKQLVQAAQTTDERKAAMDAATVLAFTKAGYKDVQPRVNVLTYGKPDRFDDAGNALPATGWLAKGRKVRPGQKAVKVKAPGMTHGMPLFHIDQTDELPKS